MSVLYVIRDWAKNYEKAQTRKCDSMKWFPKSNKHDGIGYKRLMLMSDGTALYGAWTQIEAVASKVRPKQFRGVLANENGPLTPEDIAIAVSGDVNLIARTLSVVSNPKIGWLDVYDIPASVTHSNLLEWYSTLLERHSNLLGLQDRTGHSNQKKLYSNV